ncbi:hypothetical protein [Novosphingobium sp. Chol11]|uniref:hypothetical protein n=1 Tax=Novosphingobium sp. Chol11 TaxID=1385763 RepID=UPI000BE4167C|nr:hypothetical protein [Novosphingobium sp. Chol11]
MSQLDIIQYGRDPVIREYQALLEQIEKGQPIHPQEVQMVIDALVEEGYHQQADHLAGLKANWDLG